MSANEQVVELLKRARLALDLTVPEAAAAAGISQQNWARIEQGRAQTLQAGTIAKMAWAAKVHPWELADLGFVDAAAILERMQRVQEEDRSARRRPTAAEIGEYFHDESIPIEERRRVAERFLDVLPYLLRGEEPPEARPDDRRNSA